MKLGTILLLATTAGIATPALAHHSFAMFDRNENVTVNGVVKEPHPDWASPL